jgi:hypothetical protein
MSFFIVLTKHSATYKGYLSITFDRPYRLHGEWEVALVGLSIQGGQTAFTLCDVVEYVQLTRIECNF